ncbi:MAG: hypothetical protein JNL88_02065 [Bacteroidia bacterium]|nr:hypothetical protein [Bacteroidia bacterium]
MKAIISRVYQKLPSPLSYKFWLLLAFCIKALFFILKLTLACAPPQHYQAALVGYDGGDASSYIEPIENYIANGVYFDDYRMPGYGALYYLLRLFLVQEWALNALIILQVLLSAVSVYVLGLVALKTFRKQVMFYLVFFLYGISTYVSIYDIALLTESLCVSSLIFSVFFLLSAGKRDLFISGFFLTWCVFLKPAMFPLFILFAGYLLVKDRKITWNILQYNWSRVFIFLLCFATLDGIWILRNYEKYDRIIPLTKSRYYTEFETSFMKPLFVFMNSFGGSIVFWEPGSEITFFLPLGDFVKKKVDVELPQEIYTSTFNRDSLLRIKEMIRLSVSDTISDFRKAEIEKELSSRLTLYANSIREERPYLYYIGSRIRVMKSFFVHSGTYNLFLKASFELNKAELLIKIFYSLLYVFVILFGFAGSLLLLFKGMRKPEYFLMAGIALYVALAFPLILKLDEYRYLVPGYPFLLLASAYLTLGFYAYFSPVIRK